MKYFIKLLLGFIIFFILFIILDVVFFFYTEIKEQDMYKSLKQYNKKENNQPLFFESYFLRLNKFSDIYKELNNNNGFRPIQNLESEERPVLIFGCSYAYGYVFDNTETISYVMSKYSSRPIINRAMLGWGIQHMLYQLKEDKEFVSSIKTPKYIFYVLMGTGSHFQRLFHTNFPNVTCKDYYFTYKLKNNEFVERKPFLNLYYSFAIPRHIYNKLVVSYVENSTKDDKWSNVYDFMTLHFISINKVIDKLWGEGRTKFIILTFEGNNEEIWQQKLQENGITVINIAKLIEKEDLMDPKFGFFEPEISPHPNGKLWKEVVPKLKELYPDL